MVTVVTGGDHGPLSTPTRQREKFNESTLFPRDAARALLLLYQSKLK
jgi:hypothetical protein